MKSLRRIGSLFLAAVTLAYTGGFLPAAFAQAPAPVPALPDTERRTSYNLTGSTCACSVGFALYGDSTDYQNWVEVYLNGVRVNYNDSLKGWTVTSPTGPLASTPRPVTDAVLTFSTAQTGTVQIVGARRPRRTMLFQENRGVAARDLNQGFNDIFSQNRETWDKINDVTGRALLSQPGNTVGPLPAPSTCVANYLGFDATGLNPVCLSTTTGVANFNSPPPIGNVIPNTGAFTALNITYQNTFAPGVRGPLFIWQNPSGSNLAAGQNAGLQVWIGNNPTATPAANNPEAALFAVLNGNNRLKLWGLNIICGISGPAELAGSDFIDTPCVGLEVDLFNSASGSYAPANRAFNKTSGTFSKNGLEMYSSPAVGNLTNAFSVWATSSDGNGWWYTGFEASRVKDIGYRCVVNPSGGTDTGVAFSDSCFRDDSNSATVLALGNFTHSGALIDASSGATFTGGFYKGSTSSDTNLLIKNSADFNVFLTLDSGTSVGKQAFVDYFDRGTIRWQTGKNSDNTYVIFSTSSGNSSMVVAANDAVTFKSSLTYGSASLPTTTISFTNDAAAQTATLTNSPVAGNPKKWIPINDNGTALDIPAWCHTGGC